MRNWWLLVATIKSNHQKVKIDFFDGNQFSIGCVYILGNFGGVKGISLSFFPPSFFFPPLFSLFLCSSTMAYLFLFEIMPFYFIYVLWLCFNSVFMVCVYFDLLFYFILFFQLFYLFCYYFIYFGVILFILLLFYFICLLFCLFIYFLFIFCFYSFFVLYFSLFKRLFLGRFTYPTFSLF